MDSKIGILATSIGTSLIEEASKLAFDEKTKVNPVNNLNYLTPVLSLGQDSAGVFDDFDDFNNYTQEDTIYTIPFHTKCIVTYINPTNPDAASSNRTWHKKLTVKISSDFSKDTLELSTIYSYWYFR
jgi:MSHA pilin protein MshD